VADATAAFRAVIAQHGVAEAFDRDCDGLPSDADSAHRVV
jgi:hypothetical protein